MGWLVPLGALVYTSIFLFVVFAIFLLKVGLGIFAVLLCLGLFFFLAFCAAAAISVYMSYRFVKRVFNK